MSDRSEFEAYWAKLEEESNSIGVAIKGRAHFIKRPDGEDTFQWVAGPEIESFYKQHNLKVRSSWCSDEPDITTFFFPKTQEGVAALFKLTFA